MTAAAISDDARVVAARLFGMVAVGCEVTVYQPRFRPTRRCRAGLNELVAAGVIAARAPERETWRPKVYVPLQDCRAHVAWLRRQTENQDVDFPLTERVY